MGTFAERLKGRRLKIGVTQRDFARQTQIAPGTLSAYERGHKTPTIEVALRIADALKVSIEWLCGRTDTDAKGGITTYGELMMTLDGIARCGVEVALGTGDGTAIMTLNDEDLAQMFVKWAPILELLRGGTIDAEMYEHWLEKQISETRATRIEYTK